MSRRKKRDFEILKELKKEYEFEFQRFKILDEKAMHIATSTGTILTVFIGLLAFTISELKDFDIARPTQMLILET